MVKNARNYDAAVVGGGPVGCLTAWALARNGARVLLLEANERAAHRLAGEWLHPAACDVVRRLGLSHLVQTERYATGLGFVVYPEDKSEAIRLPYRSGRVGFACDHALLVDGLRQAVSGHPHIDLLLNARVQALGAGSVTFERREASGEVTVRVGMVVGADGRRSLARRTLGLATSHDTYSRMAGILAEDVTLPHEGMGHVVLGGPGPVLAYRLDPRYVRIVLDLPLRFGSEESTAQALAEAYGPHLPPSLAAGMRRALSREPVLWAAGQIRPRTHFGREQIILVGDSVGHYHPLTAAGMTLGFGDALALAECGQLAAYRARRLRESRVAEMLAMALYEVFTDRTKEARLIHDAVYRLWRAYPAECVRTMGFLSGDDGSMTRFSRSFMRTVVLASSSVLRRAKGDRNWMELPQVGAELGRRLRWLVGGAIAAAPPRPFYGPQL
jgi:2-polyprenyl-6-methoxyphenol hydroxylase-like FAD-dependent oxidoreductase